MLEEDRKPGSRFGARAAQTVPLRSSLTIRAIACTSPRPQVTAPQVEHATTQFFGGKYSRSGCSAKEAQDDEYYLDSLAVMEEYRGQGIATALIRRFEAEARVQGNDKVALLAEESNEPAFRLYRKLGYVTEGIVRIHGDDFHHMVKLLHPVDGAETDRRKQSGA